MLLYTLLAYRSAAAVAELVVIPEPESDNCFLPYMVWYSRTTPADSPAATNIGFMLSIYAQKPSEKSIVKSRTNFNFRAGTTPDLGGLTSRLAVIRYKTAFGAAIGEDPR